MSCYNPDRPNAGPYLALIGAISDRDCPLIYEQLSRLTERLSGFETGILLNKALDHRLPLGVFEGILEHSPPLPEISPGDLVGSSSCGLIEMTTRWAGRADVLCLLLEHGASPNRSPGSAISPLDGAVLYGSLKCVTLLLGHPELDTSWTEVLLREWAARRYPGSVDEACIRAIALRFTDWDPRSGQPLPIPEPMTLEIIAEVRNWPLMERFCRERGSIPTEDGRRVLRHFCAPATRLEDWAIRVNERRAFAAALAALLESCPGLLRDEEDCRALLRFFLLFSGREVRAILRPWVESLAPRSITMSPEDWVRGKYADFPDYWLSLLPNGPTLVIDRWSAFFGGFWGGSAYGSPKPAAEDLVHILNLCPVRGRGAGSGLSPLAQTVLCYGSAGLAALLFRRPSGLLAAEPPGAMMDFIRKEAAKAMAERSRTLPPACAAALAALLERCPKLLQIEEVCRLLLRCYVCFGGETRAILHPWAESLAPRRIVMDHLDWWRMGAVRFADTWRRLLPDGPALAADRWDRDFWYMFVFMPDPAASTKTLRRVLETCPILGEARAGELSPLAEAALRCGDIPLIESLFRQPDGLLAAEDPGALLSFLMQADFPRAKRAAVAAHIRKEVSYEL